MSEKESSINLAESFKEWDEQRRLTNPYFKKLYHEIDKQMEGANRILDIGSGEGHIENVLTQDQLVITNSVDLNLEALRRFKQKRELAMLVNSNAELLPYPDNSFDKILSVNFFDSIPDAKAIVSEIGRVLVDEGTFVFFRDIPYSIEGLVTNKLANLKANGLNIDNYRVFPTINQKTNNLDQFTLVPSSLMSIAERYKSFHDINDFIGNDWYERIYSDNALVGTKAIEISKFVDWLEAEIKVQPSKNNLNISKSQPFQVLIENVQHAKFERSGLILKKHVLNINLFSSKLISFRGKNVESIYIDELANIRLHYVKEDVTTMQTEFKGRSIYYTVKHS